MANHFINGRNNHLNLSTNCYLASQFHAALGVDVKKTRLCNILGTEFPIIQGGMLWLATAELASAVSNTGALGVISPLAGMKKGEDPSENLTKKIVKTKKLPQKHFGVNLPPDHFLKVHSL